MCLSLTCTHRHTDTLLLPTPGCDIIATIHTPSQSHEGLPAGNPGMKETTRLALQQVEMRAVRIPGLSVDPISLPSSPSESPRGLSRSTPIPPGAATRALEASPGFAQACPAQQWAGLFCIATPTGRWLGQLGRGGRRPSSQDHDGYVSRRAESSLCSPRYLHSRH